MKAYELSERWGSIHRPTGIAVSGRSTGVSTDSGPVLLGKDEFDCLHVLFPIEPEVSVPVDRQSRGVVLIEQTLRSNSGNNRYADLVCTEPTLEAVFAQLCSDILGRLSADESSTLSIIVEAIGEWRDLLRSAASANRDDVGIRGELEILLQLAAVNPPQDALKAWEGPGGGIHDFKSPDGTSLEVKTSTARDSMFATIHGLDQLDPQSDHDLYVVLVRVARDEQTGASVHDLVGEIIQQGVPADPFLAKMKRHGYERDDPAGWTDPWKITDINYWHCHEDSPGMRRSEVPAQRLLGVDKVSYRLDLASMGPPLDVQDRLDVLSRFRNRTS